MEWREETWRETLGEGKGYEMGERGERVHATKEGESERASGAPSGVADDSLYCLPRTTRRFRISNAHRGTST